MRLNRHWLKATALAGLVMTAGSIAPAQQPERPGAADTPQRSARQADRRPGDQSTATANSQSDGTLAACLIIDNNKEIALAELAQQHAQHADVKAFAEKMIQDHQKFVQELQQIATAAGYEEQQLALSGAASGDDDATATPRPRGNQDANTAAARTERAADARRAARPADLEGAPSDAAVDFVSLKQEVAEQCLQTARQELGQQEAEFDMHYMGAQIMAHQGMVDMLTVFAKHASPELQPTLEQGKQTAQQHLDHAKQIKEQLATASADSPRTRQPRQPQGNH